MKYGIEMRDIEFRFEEYIRINKDFFKYFYVKWNI